MTGRELVALIHELGAEDMTVCVGSEGYASVLAECKADEYTIIGDDESRTERCLVLHDTAGYYAPSETQIYE